MSAAEPGSEDFHSVSKLTQGDDLMVSCYTWLIYQIYNEFFFFRILPVARYQFPHFQTWLHSTESLDHTVQNQPGSDLVLAACVRFWPDRAGLEASQCARIIRLATDQSELDVNQI